MKNNIKSVFARVADLFIFYGSISVAITMVAVNADGFKEWFMQHYGQEKYYIFLAGYIFFVLLVSIFFTDERVVEKVSKDLKLDVQTMKNLLGFNREYLLQRFFENQRKARER